MSFAPILPSGGYTGWTFLRRTLDSQTAALAANPTNLRDEAYFRERIGSIGTAAELVADRRLLQTALQAFGLEGDINNRFFIRKVLEDGTLNPEALSNRLADKRYQKLSAAFGFGDFSTPRTRLSDFADGILAKGRVRQFEAAVGAQDGDLRLVLNARRELAELARKGSSETSKWFEVMGSIPLRQVFEKAFGLPQGFGRLDLDRQLDTLRTRAQAAFGSDSVRQFQDPARQEDLFRRFLLRAEADAFRASGAGSAALALLQQTADLARRR
jgi:hypothetical protein